MDKGTSIRTIVLALALINQLLVTVGFNPIPGDSDSWYDVASTLFTGFTAAVAWFKNNYVTSKGKRQKEVLKQRGLTK